MREKIRVLVAEGAPSLRSTLRSMLPQDEFELVGETGEGDQALALALEKIPDCILMGVNLPQMDGVSVCREINRHVHTNVIFVSERSDREVMRQAMVAGARDFLVTPFAAALLTEAIYTVCAEHGAADMPPGSKGGTKGKVITLFSTKGGVGKSTLATNLAVALGAGTSRVALADLDLEFGVLASLLGTRPRATIVDLCRLQETIGEDLLRRVMVQAYGLPVDLLASPPSPDLAAEVDGEARRDLSRNYVGEIIDHLRSRYPFVVIDTSTGFRDANLTALDRSDVILLVTTPDIPSLKNTAAGLDILTERLEYGRDKVRVLLNCADTVVGLSPSEIAHALDYPVSYTCPTDVQTALMAANSGRPFTARRARNPLARTLHEISQNLAGTVTPENGEGAERRSLFAVLQGLPGIR